MQKALLAACLVGTALSAGAAQQTAYLLYQSPPVSVTYDDTILEGTCIETCDFNILAAEAGADAGAFSLSYSAAAPIPPRLSFSAYLYEANVPGAERVTASSIRYDIRATATATNAVLWSESVTLGSTAWAIVDKNASASEIRLDVAWTYLPGSYAAPGSGFSEFKLYELNRATFVSAVPEPESAVLLGCGLALVGWAVRRRPSAGNRAWRSATDAKFGLKG